MGCAGLRDDVGVRGLVVRTDEEAVCPLAIALIRNRAAVGRLEVRLGQKGRIALNRPVHRDLQSAQAQASPLAAVGDDVLEGGIVDPLVHGPGDDVDRQTSRLVHGGQELPGALEGGAVLGRGDARGRIEGQAVRDHLHRLLRGRRGQRLGDQIHGVLFKHAIGLRASRLALDHAAGGVRCVRGDARLREHLAVAGHQVAGDVDQHDRVLGGDRVQIVPIRMALLDDPGIVVAPADDPLAGGNLLLLDPIPQDALDIGDGARLADGLGIEIGRGELRRLHHHVGVGIEETRHQGLTAQVDHLRVRALGRHDFGHGADGQDATVLHRQRLRPVPVLDHG